MKDNRKNEVILLNKERRRSEYFYFVEDIMEMLDISQNSAYKIIRKLRKELEERGYDIGIGTSGRISKSYFHERFYCQPLSLHKDSNKHSKKNVTCRFGVTK